MTVVPKKKAIFHRGYTVQKWLTDLQALLSLSLKYGQQNLVFQYKKLMGKAHSSWLLGRPTFWVVR